MSYDSVSHDQQRLLPESLEARLVGLIGRLSGVALIAVVSAGWAALLTWSPTDPSLTQAIGGAAQNVLGQPGAVVSDLLLQLLGFAAALSLLSPMFWGFELIRRERVHGLALRLPLFPISILLIAGGLSALPTHSGWALHHGYGGMVGDLIYSLACASLTLISAERAGAIAGLVFFGAGFAALARSIGHDLNEVAALLQGARPRSAVPGLPLSSGKRSLASRFAALLNRRRAPIFDPEPGFRPSHGETDWQVEPRLSTPPDMGHQTRKVPRGYGETMPNWTPLRSEPAPQPAVVEQPHHDYAGAPLDDTDDGEPSSRGQMFDASTEAESRAIAERFAPGASSPLGIGGQAHRVASKVVRTVTRRTAGTYRKPSLNALKRPAGGKPSAEFTQTVLRGNARLLEDVLADFGVKGTIKDVRPGPVVTLFELEPSRGTKSSRVVGLSEDIARSMSASSARVAVVPGRNVIGIELPNARRETVLLREILESDAFKTEALLPIALGKGIGGEPVVADLARMPQLLVAGTTGSGKSVGVNAFILSLLFRMAPEECRFLMIDPKMLELSVYNGIPHLLCPVVTDPQKAVTALNWAVAEMDERYKRMSKLGVRSVDVYNNRIRNAQKRGETLARTVQTGFDQATGQAVYEREPMAVETMPYIVIVIDEFADLMIVAGKEIEGQVQRLAQMARAAGIHLIMATQRPSVDIITGTIKANFPTRISFKVASRIDSRTILNEQGAEQLLGQGDMLYSSGSGQIVRVHGAFVSDEEVEAIASALREQGEPRYVEGITDELTPDREQSGHDGESSGDDLFDKAVAVVLRDQKASTSYLQRRLGIGYNRAADLIERMERERIVSPASGTGKREILISEAGAGHLRN